MTLYGEQASIELCVVEWAPVNIAIHDRSQERQLTFQDIKELVGDRLENSKHGASSASVVPFATRSSKIIVASHS